MQFISVESSPLRQDGQWWITYVKESWQELKTQSSPWPAGARRIKKLCAEEARKRTIFVLSLFNNSKASQWITIDIPEGQLTRVTISHDRVFLVPIQRREIQPADSAYHPIINLLNDTQRIANDETL